MIFQRSVWFLCLWLLCQLAYAHPLGSSFLHIDEQAPGRFTMRWVPDKGIELLTPAVEPRFPSHCTQQSVVLDCGAKGMVGNIQFTNLPMHADVVLRIEWLNGNHHTEVLNGNDQSLTLSEADNGASAWYQVLSSYTVIGVEHILMGIDHLLFVLGLIILVDFQRQLVWTVTAFTLAHSATLALSVTALITVSQTPVEIIIALSILLVAVEALDKRMTLARRRPWLVAFIFGLVHGLGFAGALREVGLPEHALPLSLFAFNLGVELGQLSVILGLYGLTLLIAHRVMPVLQTRPAIIMLTYTVGSLGAYWVISRSVEMNSL